NPGGHLLVAVGGRACRVVRSRRRRVVNRPVGRGGSGNVRAGRLRVVLRGLGRAAGARGPQVGAGVGAGGAVRSEGRRPAERAAGPEARRSIRGQVSAATRASIRGGGHGETPSGTASSPLGWLRRRSPVGEQRRVR